MDFEKVRKQLEEALSNDPLNDDILCKSDPEFDFIS